MSSGNIEMGNWIALLLSLSRGVSLFPAAVKEIGGNKWGYIDARGKFVLPPAYEQASDFQEKGLAVVQLKGKTGIINGDGYFIVKPKYDSIQPFSEGRATVIDSEGFKVIDESGKEITTKAYSFVGDLQDSRAVIADTDNSGNYQYGYLNKRGKEIIPLEYQYAEDFKNGKAIVKRKDGRYALIDLTGKVLIIYPYAFVGSYGEGLLAFRNSEDGNFGYIDEQGKIVIEPQFSGAQPFVEGKAIVNKSEHFGLIDRNGKFIIKPIYHSVLNLDEGRYALGKAIDPKKPYTGSKYAIADADGHILTGFLFNEVTRYSDGLASASNDKYTFFIDKSGRRVEQLPMVSGSGSLTVVSTLIKGKIDFRTLYFNKKGELVWKPNTVIPLSSHFAVIENKYKPNKDYLVYYPQVEGIVKQESVNQTLKDLSGVRPIPANTQLESSYMGDFEVSYFKKNLLVIEINGYDYPFGAAHGMPVKKYVHIDLKNGSMYQLKDLFKPNSVYVKVISDIIGEQIKNNEKYSYLFPDAFKEIQADQPFFISEGSLNIYFAPYEIAPYAAGFPTFTIPFDEISTIIDQKSSFWRTFH